jgi:hypothetical protein
MPLSHCCHQGTLPKDQFSLLVGEVVTKILLDLRMLMVVDSDAFVACELGDILDHTGFTCRGRALE